MASTQLDKSLTDAEVNDIVAFLDSLSGPFPRHCHRPSAFVGCVMNT
jgi:cytochrome c1